MEKSYVTMEQKMCPICGNEFDSGALLLDKRMKKVFDVKTTTGYELCEKCQEKADQGYIALIVIDPNKSINDNGRVKMKNAYRTGELIHIRRKVAKDLFGEIEDRPFMFCDIALANKLKEMVGGE